jgi:hypothetical protein
LSIGGYNFVRNRSTADKTYWICSRKVTRWTLILTDLIKTYFLLNLQYSAKCSARVTTEFTRDPDGSTIHISVLAVSGAHTHEKDPKAVVILKKEMES